MPTCILTGLRAVSLFSVSQAAVDGSGVLVGARHLPDLDPRPARGRPLGGDRPPPLVEHLDRAISSGKTTTVECPVHDIEGNVIWFNTTFVPARDSKGNIKHIIGTSVNITERKQAELELQDQMETQKLLLREIDHRVRNNLSSLLALVNLSCKSARSVDELAESIRSRTQAIASIHSVLANTKWRGSDLANLILAITKPLNQKSGVTLEGPEVLIPPAQAQAIGLIVNELVTNCLKYGAMKSESGRVEISWSTQPATEFSQSILSLEWKESGGPTIEFEPSLSTGTTLIMGLARSELLGHADLSFPREGARHSILITLAAEATAQYSQSAIHASPDPLEPLRSVEEVS